ncbi:MAG: hypothetical protein EP343_10495 [Deltaproteobacteria bacterium]|nr:MAG: hypothetical protein EP343_10495 [Deltaproteobacteria bacterium]
MNIVKLFGNIGDKRASVLLLRWFMVCGLCLGVGMVACSSPRVSSCETDSDCQGNQQCVSQICLDCSLQNCSVQTREPGPEAAPSEPTQEPQTEAASEPAGPETTAESTPEPAPTEHSKEAVEPGPEAGPEWGPEAGPEPKPELPPEEPKKPVALCKTPPPLPTGPTLSQKHLEYPSQSYDIVSGTPAPLMDISPNGVWVATASMNSGLVQLWKWTKDRYVLDRTLWTEHNKGLRSIRISRDNKFLATGGVDWAIRIWKLQDGALVHTLEQHYSHVYDIDFSPDGKQLISAGYYDYRLRLWDLSTGLQTKTFYNRSGAGSTGSSAVFAVRFSPDGKQLVSGSNDDYVKVWDIASGKVVWAKKSHTSDVWSVEYSPDGSMIVSGGNDSRAKVWDSKDGSVIATLNNPNTTSDGYVYSASFSQDGNTIIMSGGSDRWVYFWDVKTKAYVYKTSALRHDSTTRIVRFRPGGTQAVSVGYDHKLRVWDLGAKPALNRMHDINPDIQYTWIPHPDGKQAWVAHTQSSSLVLWDLTTRKPVGEWSGHKEAIRSLALSPDKSTLASASSSGTILLWSVTSGKVIRTISNAHKLPVNQVAFRPNGSWLASVGDDGLVKLWNVGDGKLVKTLSGHEGRVFGAAFSPGGASLVTVGEDAKPRVWSMSSLNQAPKELSGHSSAVYSVTFDPQGKVFATTGQDRKIRVWDASSLALIKETVSHTNLIRAMAFSPNGMLLATASYDRMIKVWDAAKGTLLDTYNGHTGLVTAVRFASNQQLQSIGWDHTLRTWNLTSSRKVKTLQGHTDEVTAIAYSPKGALLASGSKDKTIRLWDTSNDKVKTTLSGHQGAITSLAWDPTGSKLVAGDDAKQVKVWDVATQKATALPDAHQAALVSVRFGPDGTWVVSVSSDGHIRMWDLKQSKLLREWKTPAGATVTDATLSKDGTSLLTTDTDRYLRFWNTADGKQSKAERRHSSAVRSVDYDNQTYYAVTGGDDNSLRFFRVPGNSYSRGLYGNADDVWVNRFSPEGEWVAAALKNNTIALWRWRESHPMKVLSGHQGRIHDLSYHPTGAWLASASADKEIKLWPMRQKTLARTQFLVPFSGATSLAYDATQHYLSVSGDNTYVRLHGASNRINYRSMYIHSGPVRALAYHPTKNWLFSGSDDRQLRITDAKSNTNGTIRSFVAHQQGVTTIALAMKATRLISGSLDQTVKVWKVDSENKTAPSLLDILAHGGQIHQVRASEDGTWLLSWASDRVVRLWSLATGQLIRTFPVNGNIAGIALRPDGSLLTIATTDGKVRVWLTTEEADDPNFVFDLKARPLVMRFDPKSRWLAVALEGQETVLLETSCFRELRRFSGGYGTPQSMAWSPAGDFLFVGDASGGVTAWRCPDCSP